MIEFEKVNEKGEKLKAYTHKSYLSKNYTQQIQRVQKRNITWSGVSFFGTTIFTYWAANNIPVLQNLIQNKLSWKGRFFIVSAAVGLVDSFCVSLLLANSLRNTHERLLKNQVYPAWFKAENVKNPDRVYFQLDDSRHNEPNIWHSAITPLQIQGMIPDIVIGDPHKPHYPVAQHHHH